jgi:hypothetical protein
MPKNGSFQAFFGRMLTEGPSLTAPLSERECLLYHYKSEHSGSKSSTLTDADGYALTPSFLDTYWGKIRILS